MTLLAIVLSVALFALALLRFRARPEIAAAAPAPRRPRPAQVPAAPPRLRDPDLQPLAWDGEETIAPRARGGLPPMPAAPTLSREESRVRDRYVALRFPGFFRTAADLQDLDRVIEAARICFEEHKYARAQELLEMATAIAPAQKRLRLAHLEIAFLRRDTATFVELARALRDAFPACGEWPEVCRLGQALAPDDALFGAVAARRGDEHYGPWPDMPNWIGASWDLTAEVMACEFHHAMGLAASRDPESRLRAA